MAHNNPQSVLVTTFTILSQKSNRYNFLPLRLSSFEKKKEKKQQTKLLLDYCTVTNCNPNPDRIGYGPNKPNTINLWESGWKNWAGDGFYNS